MGGILQVDTIKNNNATTLITQTNSTTLTFGVSGQNIVIPSGVTFNTASATVNYPAGSISNAAINASAAIAYSKLNLSNSIVNADIASSAAIATTKLGTGAVLQVVSTTKTDTASSSSSTFADITGLSVSITPSSASNKILVIAYINAAWDNALAKIGTRIMRDSTAIAIGDTAGSRIRTSGYLYVNVTNDSPFVISVNYLDSPNTTSATTYKWQFSNLDNAGIVYVNRSGVDTDSSIQSRTASGITVMEIAG